MTLLTGKKGFTLMELFVVMGIIIIIASLVLTVIPGMRKKAQKNATKAFMERLEIAIEQYYNDKRSYPDTGITALKNALSPSGTETKRYIEFDNDEVKSDNIVDTWGNPFVYTYTPPASTYFLYSTGQDGTSTTSGNDADDINNWSR